MANRFLIKPNQYLLYMVFSSDDNQIKYKKFENNAWTDEKLVIENVFPDFTVLYENKQLKIYARDFFGNIILCTEGGEDFQKSTIVKNIEFHNKLPVELYGYIFQGNHYLIYNKLNQERNNMLIWQMIKDGKVIEEKTLDLFTPLNQNKPIFKCVKVSDSLILLFYRNGNNFGYKELSLVRGETSSFNLISNNGQFITDFSCIIEGSTIHMLYIHKTFFNSQLCYKFKKGDFLSDTQILWEGQYIDLSTLKYISGTLWAFWFTTSGLYFSTSSQDSQFIKGNKYQGSLTSKPEKGLYLDYKQSESYLLNDVYFNDLGENSIILIPEIIENFFPVTYQKEKIAEQEEKKQIKSMDSKPVDRAQKLTDQEKRKIAWKNWESYRNPEDHHLQRDVTPYDPHGNKYLKKIQEKDIEIMKLKASILGKEDNTVLVNQKIQQSLELLRVENIRLKQEYEKTVLNMNKRMKQIDAEKVNLEKELLELKAFLKEKEKEELSIENHENMDTF